MSVIPPYLVPDRIKRAELLGLRALMMGPVVTGFIQTCNGQHETDACQERGGLLKKHERPPL